MEYFVGILVSLIVEIIKQRFGTAQLGTFITLAILSLIASIAYTLLLHTAYAPTIIAILTTAGSFHNFILRRM